MPEQRLVRGGASAECSRWLIGLVFDGCLGPGLKVSLSLVLSLVLALAPVESAQATVDDVFARVRVDDVAGLGRLLVQGYDIDSVDGSGDSLLIVAAREGAAGAVKLLLARKAKPDYRNKAGDTAVMVAALNGHLPAVQLLADAGAQLARPGWTALHYAAFGGHVEVCRYLLGRDADIDARSPNGTTPLMMAARQGHLEAARLLVWEVADVSLRNEAGLTALGLAERGKFVDIVALLRKAGAR